MSSFFVFCSINTFVMGSVSFVFDIYINDVLSLCVVFDCDVSNGHFLCFVFDCTLIMLCCLVMFDYAKLPSYLLSPHVGRNRRKLDRIQKKHNNQTEEQLP